MNYLGHAIVSNDFGEKLIGNLIGDFYKGLVENSGYSELIREGLVLHRMIDELSDRHPSCLRAKNIFRLDYKLYSGPIVDVVWDYFLANDPSIFSDEASLKSFCDNVYSTIEANRVFIPEKAHLLFTHMIQEDWLYDVRHLKGLKKALDRLMYRFKNEMTAEAAFQLTMKHYYELNQMYMEFIDDLKEKLKFG